MDATELSLHRMNTVAYIAANPVVISLIPQTKEETASGGYIITQGTPREPQTFRVIKTELSSPPLLVLQDGTQREQTHTLVAQWDAQIAIGDYWISNDLRKWEVADVVSVLDYALHALVTERGR